VPDSGHHLVEPNERFKRVDQILLDALDRSPATRDAFLESACGSDVDVRREVEALLRAHDQSATILDRSAAEWLDAAEPDWCGRRVGPYRVLRIVGRGGMSNVYEAETVQDGRRVALKVLRGGLVGRSAIRRFEYESRILGALKHPGIAQVFEAGTHRDGSATVPFFAMELVSDARTILTYASEQHLTLQDRLATFLQVCDAVQHGHQRGVIHRDLKPDNILVDSSGICRVIDFGVARVTDSDIQTTLQTRAGQIIGTVAYMSPEQVLGDPDDIDTRSDVYALGVVGYELLIGRLPYAIKGLPITEAGRIIREVDPARVGGGVHRDIEIILMKSLQKDPARRYGSVAELAQDIRRFLNNEPITARPPTLADQLGMLGRRHKSVLIGGAGLFVATVVFSIVISLLYARAEHDRQRAVEAEHRAQTQAKRATAEAHTAEQTLESLTGLIAGLNPFVKYDISSPDDMGFTPLQILDRAADNVAVQLAERPVERAAVLVTLAESYRQLGDCHKALAAYEQVLQIRRSHLGEEHLAVAEALLGLGQTWRVYGESARGGEFIRAGWEMHQRLAEPSDVNSYGVKLMSYELIANGEPETALALLQEQADRLEVDQGEFGSGVIGLLMSRATFLRGLHRYDEAEAVIQDVLTRVIPATQRPQARYWPQRVLGRIYGIRGEFDRAEGTLEETVVGLEDQLGPIHPHVAYAMSDLAIVLAQRGERVREEAILRRALHIQQAALGEMHYDTLNSLEALGTNLLHQGRTAEAMEILERCLNGRRLQQSPLHQAYYSTAGALFAALESEGHDVRAAELIDAAVTRALSEIDAPDSQRNGYGHVGTSILFLSIKGGTRFFEEALARLEERRGVDDVVTRTFAGRLGAAMFARIRELRDALQPDAAVALAQELVALKAQYPQVGLKHRSPHVELAEALRAAGQYSEAGDAYRLALTEIRENVALTDPESIQMEHMLALTLVSAGQYDDALLHYRNALELWQTLGMEWQERRLAVRTCIASVYGYQGDHRRALQDLQVVVVELGQLPEHPGTTYVWALIRVLDLHLALGQNEAAWATSAEALALIDAVFDQRVHDGLVAAGELHAARARMRMLEGDIAAAETEIVMAMDRFEQWGPEDNHYLAWGRSIFAEIQARQGNSGSAILLRHNLNILNHVLGAHHPWTRTVREWAAQHHDAQPSG
jgi:non-specific serine/threonine protein kinase/serine/threonine-protein kinase